MTLPPEQLYRARARTVSGDEIFEVGETQWGVRQKLADRLIGMRVVPDSVEVHVYKFSGKVA